MQGDRHAGQPPQPVAAAPEPSSSGGLSDRRAPPLLAAQHCTHCKTNVVVSTITCHAVQIQLPEQIKHVVCKAMEAAAIPVPTTEERWEQAAHALKVRPEYAGYIGTLTVLSSKLLAPP